MNENEMYINDLLDKSRKAQQQIEFLDQNSLDKISAALIYKFTNQNLAEEIAEFCVDETKIGNVTSKTEKFTKKLPSIFYDIKDTKTVGVIEKNEILGIEKIAKPVGVIAALVPSTNPEATPIFKGVLGIRARNSVIFAPHPASKETTLKVVNIMREILKNNGYPEDLLICIDKPSKELSKLLMAGADLTMATGSGEMVKAAYSSGKPAYGVGAGNATIVVDETADLKDAAKKIAQGKTGDNASGCSAENSLIIQNKKYHEMVNNLMENGGKLLSSEEKSRLQNVMWQDGKLSREIVAKPIETLSELADISIDDDTKFFMVEEFGIGKTYPFSGEKMSLVLTLYKYEEFTEAIEKVNDITSYSGYGHSCGIHSFDENNIKELALKTKTTKVLVRQPHGAGNSGNWFNGLAKTFSLGCGTWGGNIVSENITQKHYMNTTWLTTPIDRQPKSNEEIFGELLSGMKF